ncbi:hypothetical protein HN587_07040 [Candidatus Woesearchaeota archaeon]|jgi:hypothetical protein|nr:hypothetical protein [Candidatus Woesearchaeota archaeon]
MAINLEQEILKTNAEKVLERIRNFGLEIIDPTYRDFDPEIRKAHDYGLEHGIFDKTDVENARRLYEARKNEPKSPPDDYRQRLISRVNNSGGWSCGSDARQKLERYEERRRKDIDEGSW